MNENPFPNMSDEEIVQTGKRFGYGNWLQPIINANETAEVASEAPTMTPVSEPCGRRGRGRPRVNKTRDQSAAEV